MKKLLLLVGISVLISCQQNPLPLIERFEVKRGTNIAHWLSQSQRRGTEREMFFTEEDVKAIASMGFDHIRLPIDEEQMWDESGARHDDAFELMKKCINWSLESNLRVIVDLHILRSHHFNHQEKPLWNDVVEQEKFYDLWRDLSKFLNHFPNGKLAYELMNEAVADDPELWNNLLANAFKAIRVLEPERTIVIGSNRWQSVHTFDDLKVPEDDSNILLSFHFYEPFLLTHFNASWTELKDYSGPVHYPGVILTRGEYDNLPDEWKPVAEKWIDKEFNIDVMLDMWHQPIEKAKALGLPLYCGEFGIIKGPPESDRLNWYKDMIQLFDQQNIGYANWNYKSGSFGLVENDGQSNEALIRIMVP